MRAHLVVVVVVFSGDLMSACRVYWYHLFTMCNTNNTMYITSDGVA